MLAISTEMHLIIHSVILSGWINIAEVVAENMSIWQQGGMPYLELLPGTVSCPCTKRERRPPWLSFVRGAGAQLLRFSKELTAELTRSCKGKGQAFLGYQRQN
jgi:hypothetical protein